MACEHHFFNAVACIDRQRLGITLLNAPYGNRNWASGACIAINPSGPTEKSGVSGSTGRPLSFPAIRGFTPIFYLPTDSAEHAYVVERHGRTVGRTDCSNWDPGRTAMTPRYDSETPPPPHPPSCSYSLLSSLPLKRFHLTVMVTFVPPPSLLNRIYTYSSHLLSDTVGFWSVFVFPFSIP